MKKYHSCEMWQKCVSLEVREMVPLDELSGFMQTHNIEMNNYGLPLCPDMHLMF